MDNKKLHDYIAYLERKVDILETELSNLDQTLLDAGFPEGVKTLKHALTDISLEPIREQLPFDFFF